MIVRRQNIYRAQQTTLEPVESSPYSLDLVSLDFDEKTGLRWEVQNIISTVKPVYKSQPRGNQNTGILYNSPLFRGWFVFINHCFLKHWPVFYSLSISTSNVTYENCSEQLMKEICISNFCVRGKVLSNLLSKSMSFDRTDWVAGNTHYYLW